MILGNGSKLSHTLRIVILFLRAALGLDFLYLGLCTIFAPGIRDQFSGRSLGDLYMWLGSIPKTGPLQTIFAWTFLIVGICLILGILTRLACVAGITLGIISIVPTITISNIAPARFVGDNIIVILCL